MTAADHERGAKHVEVVAGILRDAGGRILLAQRPEGKHLAGTWEFPGGKREPGESPERALAREFSEELGIALDAVRPWLTITHAYPELTVRLALYEVDRWHGEPYGREGQALRWVAPAAMHELPMPPADRPIVRAFGLDPRHAIAPAPDTAGGPDAVLEWTRACLEAGGRLLRLRAGTLQGEALEELAARFGALVRERGARWLLDAPPALARGVESDGIHLDTVRLRGTRTRPVGSCALVSAACRTDDDLVRAARLEADFVTLSPIRAAPGEAWGRPPLGWSGFARLCRRASVPVYALGGVTGDELDTSRGHGGFGIAGTRVFDSAP